MEIEVTKQDIAKAKTLRTKSNNRTIRMGYSARLHCPIAQAVRRLNPDAEINVEEETLIVDDKYCYMPAIARTFIVNFDAGENVSPITFEVCEDV